MNYVDQLVLKIEINHMLLNSFFNILNFVVLIKNINFVPITKQVFILILLKILYEVHKH
jgi:hypothetical protein